MDDIETTDTIVETPLAQTLAIELLHSAAITAGVWIGFGVAGLAITKANEIRKNRAAKKNAPTED